jgi:hypothetical protein
MSRIKLVGMVASALILLALVSAACSGGGANETPPRDSESANRTIKVYENPT